MTFRWGRTGKVKKQFWQSLWPFWCSFYPLKLKQASWSLVNSEGRTFYVRVLIEFNAQVWQKSMLKQHALATNVMVIITMHIGMVSRIIRGLDSVLLYLVKVTKTYDSIRTMCNRFNMEGKNFAWFRLGQFYYCDSTQESKLSEHDLAHFSPVCIVWTLKL